MGLEIPWMHHFMAQIICMEAMLGDGNILPTAESRESWDF